VSGLVPARDLISSLLARRWDRIVLPHSMFDLQGMRTIDGVTPQEIAEAIGAPVAVASSPRDLLGRTLHRMDDTWALPSIQAPDVPIEEAPLSCAAS
jgi:hypothetical protein